MVEGMPVMPQQNAKRLEATNGKLAEESETLHAKTSTGISEFSTQIGQDQEAQELQAVRDKYAAARTSSGLQQETGSNMAVSELPQDGTPKSGVIYDIFIRTYPVDYPWLAFCLRSIAQYATGFRKIWIVTPEQPLGTLPSGTDIEWKVMNEEAPDGYLSQQIHKLYADVITNYEADYILHIDSDTLFTRPVTPADFFAGGWSAGKLIWYYTPYEQTETPWKPITEKFMKVEVKNEFMRRLPMMVPRFLYDELRKNCFSNHNLILSDYIRKQPYREFSEFNVLGAMAFIHHQDDFEWINTTKGEMPEPFARQFFSWGGLTDEVKAEIQTILGGGDASCPKDSNPSIETEGSTIGSSPAPNVQSAGAAEDGYESPGDHIRWLRDYAAVSPSRRQYVLHQLAKHKLVKRKEDKRLAKA